MQTIALCLSLLANDVDKAKADLRKAATDVDLAGVRDAASRLVASERRAAVDALLDGYGVCANAIKLLWTDKTKYMTQKEANADYKVDRTQRPPVPASKADEQKMLAWREAEKAGQATESMIMAAEACKQSIVAALGTFKGDEAVKELIAELPGNSNAMKRAGVAEALGHLQHASIPPALAEAAKRDAEPMVRAMALDSIRRLKADAPEVVAAVVEQLKHEFWQVKSAAAQALLVLKPRSAVEPLIEALGKADGRLKQEFREALVAITNVDKHLDAATWKAWLDENRASFADGSYQPRPEERAGAPRAAATTFYGIPVESKNVIFILDRSGSMRAPSEWEIPNDVATGVPMTPGADIKLQGNRKIDVARWQLKRTLAQLPDGIEFNVIFYSHEWTILSEKMQKLSAATRKKAYDFIDALEPDGQTNIYDPLEKGLSFATSGAAMGYTLSKNGADTIFFLTDGMPNAGQIPDANQILVKVKELNKNSRVKIHAIGVFSSGGEGGNRGRNEQEEGGAFLRQLAADHNGKYTAAEKKKEMAPPKK
jgi:HEAT repeat protein